MAEAYKVVIGIHLQNHISGVLGALSRDFMVADERAKRLQRTLKEIRFLGIAGAAVGGAGFLGLGMFEKVLRPAREYAHQLSIMNTAGLKQRELAEGVADAWRTTGTVMTTTATENLRALLDLRNVLVGTQRERYGRNLPAEGSAAFLAMQRDDWAAARAQLGPVQMMEAAMRAADPKYAAGAGREFAFSAAKALDILGWAADPKKFAEGLQLMGQTGIWSQNRVTPEQFGSVAFYARQAGISMSPDYLFGPVAALMLERSSGGAGGGSRGIGPALAAMYRFAVQGFGVNRQTLPMLKELGLLGPNATLRTTTQGTTVGPMVGSGLAAENMYDWVKTVLGPRTDAYLRRHGMAVTPQNEAMVIGQLARGNQLAAWGFGQFWLKQANIERDIELRKQAMRPDAAYKYALGHDPETAFAALAAQWENVKTALGMAVIPELVPFLTNVAGGLQGLSGYLERNQGVAQALMYSFAGLSAAMAISGGVLERDEIRLIVSCIGEIV